jgi:predicted permease
MTSLSSVVAIMFDSLIAMVKIFLISIVGVVLAKYPEKDPILPPLMIKYLSKLSNNVFVPCLIISSLGSAVTIQLLLRMGILIIFSGITNTISYGYGFTFGRLLHGSDDAMFTALIVAIGSPNAVSLPIMVLQTMCEETYVNKDYNGSPRECYTEATSMIFVYSVGWHLLFWSYGFEKLKTMKERLNAESTAIVPSPTNSVFPISANQDFYTRMKNVLSVIYYKNYKFMIWAKTILLTPAIVGICIGVAIGLIPYLQLLIFDEISALRPFGSAISTLGEPVVAINCLVMSASFAQVDLFSKNNDNVETDNKSSTISGNINDEKIVSNEDAVHKSQSVSEKKHRKFLSNVISVPKVAPARQYSRINNNDENNDEGSDIDTYQLSTIEEGKTEPSHFNKNNEEQKEIESNVMNEGKLSYMIHDNNETNISEDKLNIDELSENGSDESILELYANKSRNTPSEEWNSSRSSSSIAADKHEDKQLVNIKEKTLKLPSWRSIFALILCRLVNIILLNFSCAKKSCHEVSS